jgi:hypothetical protein
MKDKATKVSKEAPVRIDHPGMMGDGTEEQNLNETGDPAARITRADVEAAFPPPASKKVKPDSDPSN